MACTLRSPPPRSLTPRAMPRAASNPTPRSRTLKLRIRGQAPTQHTPDRRGARRGPKSGASGSKAAAASCACVVVSAADGGAHTASAHCPAGARGAGCQALCAKHTALRRQGRRLPPMPGLHLTNLQVYSKHPQSSQGPHYTTLQLLGVSLAGLPQ